MRGERQRPARAGQEEYAWGSKWGQNGGLRGVCEGLPGEVERLLREEEAGRERGSRGAKGVETP